MIKCKAKRSVISNLENINAVDDDDDAGGGSDSRVGGRSCATMHRIHVWLSSFAHVR